MFISSSDLGSICWSSLRNKYLLKDIINSRKRNQLLFERSISTETPKHKSYKNRETQRQSFDNKRKVQTNYDILGVDRNASQKEIKTAYYSLSKTCHPDVNTSSEAETQFREITDAYEVLANNESKRLYDSTIGNHFTQKKTINNSDINQENLNNYRDFGRFRNNFNETQDLNQKLKKRRTIRMENVYKSSDEFPKGRPYADPLKYDSKEYFRDHFNEEIMREYSEQIEKRAKEFQRMQEEAHEEGKLKVIVLLTMILVVISINFIDNKFNLSESSKNDNKSDPKYK